MGGRQSGNEEWQVISLGGRMAENSEAVGKRARKVERLYPLAFFLGLR
jgi:hypothetical protein